MISVVILTKNEEHDLPACLASVDWCDDVHVFDSFSNDRTVELAQAAGAIVTQRQFDGYASQRNAALQTVTYKNPWIFILDADERVPREQVAILAVELTNAAAEVSAFRIRRRDFINNTWLKHAQISPYYIRIVRVGKASYHREINEVIEIDGAISDSAAYFNHYPFSKGIAHWLSRHNQYASMEAVRLVEERNGQAEFSLYQALRGKDFNQRRFHQKGLFYKLPARPALKWLYMMIWRRAFLDGRAGVKYTTLQVIYEYFIVIKTEEMLEQQAQSGSDSAAQLKAAENNQNRDA